MNPKTLPDPQTAASVKRALRVHADPERAKLCLRFFRTGPGEYGEGDRFLGPSVPQVRAVVRRHRALPEAEILALLASPWHEDRLAALLIWVEQAKDAAKLPTIAKDYLAQASRINNWDLVDTSADKILGPWVAADPAKRFATVERLACSKDLWERRIAILTTFHFTRRGDVSACLRIVEALIDDAHDLIHKACGWMLREAEKREPAAVRVFLQKHLHRLPRTLLRYAIERFPEPERRRYLAKTKNP